MKIMFYLVICLSDTAGATSPLSLPSKLQAKWRPLLRGGKDMIWHDPGDMHLDWLKGHFTFCCKQFRNPHFHPRLHMEKVCCVLVIVAVVEWTVQIRGEGGWFTPFALCKNADFPVSNSGIADFSLSGPRHSWGTRGRKDFIESKQIEKS